MARRCNPKGLTRVEVLVVVLVGVFALSLLPVVSYRRAKSAPRPPRLRCQPGRARQGDAPLRQRLRRTRSPRAGGRITTVGRDRPVERIQSLRGVMGWQPDGSGGAATISSCFYLLVKYAEVLPKSFVCPGDTGNHGIPAARTEPNFPEGFAVDRRLGFRPGGLQALQLRLSHTLRPVRPQRPPHDPACRWRRTAIRG